MNSEINKAAEALRCAKQVFVLTGAGISGEQVGASSDSEKEVIALRRKLREVEMERDILKKAALIFGRSG
jgi:transposase-like protein